MTVTPPDAPTIYYAPTVTATGLPPIPPSASTPSAVLTWLAGRGPITSLGSVALIGVAVYGFVTGHVAVLTDWQLLVVSLGIQIPPNV